MARRDPRDKKRISYANNRRNAYAENDKSSRNAVRLNKRFPHRADRHRVQRILRDAVGAPADGAADEVEERLGRRRVVHRQQSGGKQQRDGEAREEHHAREVNSGRCTGDSGAQGR